MVTHYAYITLNKHLLTRINIRYGFKHSPADEFATYVLNKFGDFAYSSMTRLPADTYLSFDISNLHTSDDSPSLPPPPIVTEDIQYFLINEFKQFIIPVVKDISNMETIFLATAEDNPPLSWIFNNGAARVAIMAYLGKKLDMDAGIVRALMIERYQSVASAIHEQPVDSFLDKVISELY